MTSPTVLRRAAALSAAADLRIAAALVLLGLLARLAFIGAKPLWYDEAASIEFAAATWSDLFGILSRHETNPPAYYAFLKLWIGVAGTSEFALRLPSAVASSLAIAPLYAFARRAFDRATAIAAALLLAFWAIPIAYAQNARAYAFFGLAFCCGLWAAARLADRSAREPLPWLDIATFGVCAGAMLHLHYTGFVAVVALDIYALVRVAADRRFSLRGLMPLALANLLAAILAVPLLYYLVALMSDPAPTRPQTDSPALAEAASIYAQVYGFAYLYSLRDTANAVLGAALVIGLSCAYRRRAWPLAAVAAAFATVLALFFGVSHLKPILLDRPLVFAIPLVLCVVAFGLVHLERRWIRYGLALILAAFVARSLANYYVESSGDRYDEVAVALEREGGPGSAVVMWDVHDAFGVLYYLGRREWHAPTFVAPRPNVTLQRLLASRIPRTKAIDSAAACGALKPFRKVLVVHRLVIDRSRFVQFLGLAASFDGERRIGNHAVEVWSDVRCS